MKAVPLRFVADVRTSSVDKHIHDGELPVQLCNYVDVYRKDVVRPGPDLMRATATPEEIARFRLEQGDTVLTKDSEDPSEMGISAFIDGTADDFVCGYHLAIARPTGAVHAKFLNWAIRSRPVLDHFTQHSSGISRYGLSLSGLRSAPIPYAELGEQRRIADFLDDRVARIDQIITARRQQTALIDAWHTTALQQLQDDLVARHGETRLGRLLSGLEQGWSPQADSTPASEDEWGVVRSGCVNDGVFRPQDNKRLPDDLEPRVQYEIRPGDLLMSRASGSLDKIGSVAVVPSGVRDRLLLCDKIYRLSASGGWLVEFLAPMMRTQKNRELIRLGVSGAEGMANNLPSGIVRSLLIPYAPAADQERTARTAAQLAGQREGLKHTHSVSIGLLTEYKQSLITAAVSGELDVSTAGSRIPG